MINTNGCIYIPDREGKIFRLANLPISFTLQAQKLSIKLKTNNMNDLQNKVAYITDDRKVIGYGTAKILLGLGMRVAITSRSLAAQQPA